MKALFVTVLFVFGSVAQASSCVCSYTYQMYTYGTPVPVSASAECLNNERFQNECYGNATDSELTAVCYDRQTGRVNQNTSFVGGASVGWGNCSIR